MALTTALPKFPWLEQFQPLAIDPTRDYTAVQLVLTPSAPTGNNHTLGVPAELGDLGAVVTPPTAAETFRSLFKFFGDDSQATSPNSKVEAAEIAVLERHDIHSRSAPDPQALFTDPAGQTKNLVSGLGYTPTLKTSHGSGHEQGGLSGRPAAQVPVVINLEAEDQSTTGTQRMTDSSMPRLRFDHLPTQQIQLWLRPFPINADSELRWWYDCILMSPIMLKKSPDIPSQVERHPFQWSGKLFRSNTNGRSVDLLAMLGGVHLGDQAPLRLAADPSLPLSPDWRFLPGKTACSFLQNFCEKNSSNETATQFFHKMIGTYDRFGDPIMAGQPHIIPWFRPKFFEDSPALLQGFQKPVFGHGLDYAYSCSSLPNQVSCWHFLSSLDRLPNGLLSPKGLSATQLVQVVTNYRACFETIFANGCDYQ